MLARDARGFPVLLADPVEDAPSTPPVAPPPPPSARPAAVDHVEWSRRRDAVIDAAREFEELTEQDLRERLRGVTTKPLDDADLEQFRVDVRAVVLDDLADALDHRTRGRLRGRRVVRITMPKGYLRKVMRTITSDEADQLETRLRARGWSDKQVKDDLRAKLGHLDTSPTD